VVNCVAVKVGWLHQEDKERDECLGGELVNLVNGNYQFSQGSLVR
jgi:hypothetical protein